MRGWSGNAVACAGCTCVVGSLLAWPAGARTPPIHPLLCAPWTHARTHAIAQVDVANVDVAAGVTVHWHGLVLGPEDAWADGVQGLTQEPIPPGG